MQLQITPPSCLFSQILFSGLCWGPMLCCKPPKQRKAIVFSPEDDHTEPASISRIEDDHKEPASISRNREVAQNAEQLSSPFQLHPRKSPPRMSIEITENDHRQAATRGAAQNVITPEDDHREPASISSVSQYDH